VVLLSSVSPPETPKPAFSNDPSMGGAGTLLFPKGFFHGVQIEISVQGEVANGVNEMQGKLHLHFLKKISVLARKQKNSV